VTPNASQHPLDQQLAALLQRLGSIAPEQLPLLTSLIHRLSSKTREGVIAVPRQVWADEHWQSLCSLSVVGQPGDYKPIIANNDYAWLYRYWQYEQRLAQGLAQRIKPIKLPVHALGDLQTQAVQLALQQAFLIISGGPGTGKTTTVTRILAELIQQGIAGHRILLAAPTGKAAMRMQEAIQQTSQRLQLDPQIVAQLPKQAQTLHRLLGYRPLQTSFWHSAHNPLAADVVIVDEASMIDIAMMTHLVEAVPPTAKLILLGDKDQLASVETGSIFRDLCAGTALAQHTVVLQKSYRFAATDGVGQLAKAIQTADELRLLAVLDTPDYATVSLNEMQTGLELAWLQQAWQAYIQAVRANQLNDAFQAFNAMRILTPLRKGKQGAEALNAWIDNAMQRLMPHATSRRPWYVGRPIMVTQNDYQQNLFNGDIGISLLDAQGQLKVYFAGEHAGQFRAIAPVRLPAHETAWAMTIHKSQGSEFDKVLLILPDAEDSGLLGRELLYTAVTRAKVAVDIWAKRGTLLKALQQVTPASSQIDTHLKQFMQMQ
jgi:exodeoxyribonuclease V alpha subunit